MRLAVLLLSCAIALPTAAQSAFGWGPPPVQLNYGETKELTVSYSRSNSSTAETITYWSCNPDVAYLLGTLTLPAGSYSGSGRITVTGMAPGFTHVCTRNDRVFSLTVKCGPLPDPEAAEPHVKTSVGKTVTLSVLTAPLPNMMYRWYAGRVGDTSTPILGQ